MSINSPETSQAAPVVKEPQSRFPDAIAKIAVNVITLALAVALGVYIGQGGMSRVGGDSQASSGGIPGGVPINGYVAKSGIGLSQPTLLGSKFALGENTIADIAAQVAPAVVNIDIHTHVKAQTFRSPFGDFEFFFGQGGGGGNGSPFENGVPHQFEGKGAASGVIIRPDGYILTNNHVVKDATEIQVTLSDKRIFKGRVVGRDAYGDLALVKIDATNLPTMKLGVSKVLRPGDWAIAIGNPLGLNHTVTLGIISAIGRRQDELNHNVEMLQTDAAINPGNSGGPLLNIRGEVIGINTAISSRGQNIGFAIPIDSAMPIVNSLLAHGTMQRPFIGIVMQELTNQLSASLGLPANSKGVVVAQVVSDSPAEAAGIKQGDLIERVDGKSAESSQQVQDLVRGHKVGDSLNFLILRESKLQPVTLKIGEYPESQQDE